MSENNKNLNFDKALLAIESIAESFVVDVWVPSAKKTYKFREIDAKQQKSLLASALNSSVYNTNFVKSFYKILEKNFVSEEGIEVLNEFTIYDKLAIALALKKQILDETRVVFDEKNNVVKNIKLDSILVKFINFETPQDVNAEFKNDSVSIDIKIGLPTIKKEFDYESEIHKKEKKVDDIKNIEDVQNIVADAFISETSKYIKEVLINGEDIKYQDFDFYKKIILVEKLPSAIIQKILENVSKWKKEIDSVLTVETEENDQKYTKVISIDSLLFLS
jgi:hypothetical protein